MAAPAQSEVSAAAAPKPPVAPRTETAPTSAAAGVPDGVLGKLGRNGKFDNLRAAGVNTRLVSSRPPIPGGTLVHDPDPRIGDYWDLSGPGTTHGSDYDQTDRHGTQDWDDRQGGSRPYSQYDYPTNDDER